MSSGSARRLLSPVVFGSRPLWSSISSSSWPAAAAAGGWVGGSGCRCCAASTPQFSSAWHQRRWASGGSGGGGDAQQPEQDKQQQQQQQQQQQLQQQPDADGFVRAYEGFFSRPHKRLKIASLLNTFASLAAAPLIVELAPASALARVAVSTSVVAFALLTTLALHGFTAPYAHEVRLRPADGRVRVQTLRLLGRRRWDEFGLQDIGEPTGYHPLATFMAKGRTFYVDRATCSPELLRALEPFAPSPPPSQEGGEEGEGDGDKGRQQAEEEQEEEQQRPQAGPGGR